MNFEDFRKDIEKKLQDIARFKLLEFHYEPYSFGNGLIAYQIKGRNHKFIFEARDNQLTWLISKPHEKYFGGSFQKFKKFDGLHISITDLDNGI
tara:strand:- start:432 stop:713 length:282 start_codon:yes stop_codon:yes gene_type:complete